MYKFCFSTCHTWTNISTQFATTHVLLWCVLNRFHKLSEDQPRDFLSLGNLLKCFLLCQYFASIKSSNVFLRSAKTTMSMIDSCQLFVFRNVIFFSSYTWQGRYFAFLSLRRFLRRYTFIVVRELLISLGCEHHWRLSWKAISWYTKRNHHTGKCPPLPIIWYPVQDPTFSIGIFLFDSTFSTLTWCIRMKIWKVALHQLIPIQYYIIDSQGAEH